MTTEEERDQPPAPPCTLVVFGATGDLMRRKLAPALRNLHRERLLPESFCVIGTSRSNWTTEEFRARMRSSIEDFASGDFDENRWAWLESRLFYQPGDFQDPGAYRALGDRLRELEGEYKTHGNVLFYLACAPDFFAPIVEHLHEADLTSDDEGWRRVIVEKPFGRDLESARELNRRLGSILDESQIYRIDHYLGKETVQNLLVFRLANGVFEPIWNTRYVDHVQITVAETLGVEGRGGYYDEAGALRDMVPNHIFQLISLVAMEPPISFQADAVRDEQAKVMRAIQPPTHEQVLTQTVRGQYGAGKAGGKELPAYRDEPDVDKSSTTETFVAMKLAIENWRWNGVPYYVRVGKGMARKVTEIVIEFKRPPFLLFRDTPVDRLPRNRITINVQPDEGITLHFGAKVPGSVLRIDGVDMDFKYSEQFGRIPATGYERLLHDAMGGDQTLFQRTDLLDASWRVVEPILDVWHALEPKDFPNYPAGSFGPEAADELMTRDNRRWCTAPPDDKG